MKAELGWKTDRRGVSRKNLFWNKQVEWQKETFREPARGQGWTCLWMDGCCLWCQWPEASSQSNKMASSAQQAGCEPAVVENLAWSQLVVPTCCNNSLRPKAACSGRRSPTLCSVLFAIPQLHLGATQLLSHLPAASWNAGHTWPSAGLPGCPGSSWPPLIWKPKRGTETAPSQAKQVPSQTSLLKCMYISMGHSGSCARTEGYRVDGHCFMKSTQQEFWMKPAMQFQS